MNKIKHNYTLGIDVIEQGGIEAIKRTCEKGNFVNIPLEEIERRASNPKDRFTIQFKKVLEYITDNSKKIENKNEFEMVSGGILSWDKPNKENSIFLTKDKSIESKLKREGKIKGEHFTKPDFLHYGPELLDLGVIDFEYNNHPKELTLEDFLENSKLEEVYNNQLIVVNKGAAVYTVREDLKKDNTGFRFRINEDMPVRLELIDPKNTKKIFSDMKLRKLEQELAYRQLTDPNIEFNIIAGGSGSGKTFLSYMAGIQMILGNEKLRESGEIYNGMILFKANDKIGGVDRQEGWLPGTIEDKTANYFASFKRIHDSNLSKYFTWEDMQIPQRKNTNKDGKPKELSYPLSTGEKVYLPINEPAIEFGHLQYARGMTFEKKLIIVDETQNFAPYEIKQLVERVGIGSKIILIGDYEQIDNPSLSRDFNGLVYVATTMFGTHPRFAMNSLYNNSRSDSANIMRKNDAPLL